MARQSNRSPALRTAQGLPPQATPQPSPSSIALRLTPVCTAVLIGIGVHMGAGLLTQTSGTAHAQTASLGDATARSYNIPAGALGTSLASFASQSGLLLSFDPALTSGLNAPALSGSHTVRGALERLLAGSGLEVETRGDGSYALRRAPQRANSEVATLPEVVVTATATGITEGTGSFTTDSTSAATGMNLSLRETPQSVSVVTRERMDQQQLNSLLQVLDQTVGIALTGAAGMPTGGDQGIYSRGYQVTNFQVDGVTTNRFAWSNTGFAGLDTAIYDSVAVVRGATGLLTGAGDPSGSISLTRKRPTHNFQASLEGGLGRWDQRRIVADVGGPINTSGGVRARLIGAYDERGSWVNDYESERSIFYGIIEADLAEKTTLNFAIERTKDNGTGGEPDSGLSLFFSDGGLSNFSRHDRNFLDWANLSDRRTTLSTKLEHRFNSSWDANLSYSHSSRSHDLIDAKLGSITPDYYANSYDGLKVGGDYRVKNFDAKLNGMYDFFGRQHDFLVGFNTTEYEIDRHTNQWFSGGEGGPISGIFPEPDWSSVTNTASVANNKQSGLFLSTRVRFSDDFSGIFGGRWSNWRSYGEVVANGFIWDDREYKNEFTPYVGLVYDVSPSISTYASYTEIFNPQSVKDENDRLLDPETGSNIELGVKGEWFGGRLNASAALFETRKDNLAVRDGDKKTPSGDPAYRAEDGTKGRGFELEASGQLSNNWQIQGGYTRFNLRDSQGERLSTSSSPIHQFKIFGSYTPVSVANLTIGGGLRWQSKIYANHYTDARQYHAIQKSYAVADLMAKYQISSNIDIAVNINNIFNKNYRTSTATHAYGAQRNISAAMKYKF